MIAEPHRSRLPNFIGIGAPKAGTTWLARCLGEHPQIYMPAAKELVVFDYGDFEERLPEYLEHFAGVRDELAIGEFTTRYLASERPAPRIQKLIPDARFLVCLRNPSDQVYSHYWHLSRQNFHQATPQPAWTFEQAIEKFPDHILKPARYWDQLQYWLKFFDQDRFHIIIYDDIAARPEHVLQEVFQFLNVDPNFRPTSLTESETTAVRKGSSPRSKIASQIHRRLYTVLSRSIYLPLKRTIGVRRADRIKDLIRVRPLLESLFFRKGYPQMNRATRDRLNQEFSAQTAGIAGLLKRDLSSWK